MNIKLQTVRNKQKNITNNFPRRIQPWKFYLIKIKNPIKCTFNQFFEW